MAAKLIRDNETSHAHDQYEKKHINLRHWRALKEGKNGLYIILKNFRLYFIPEYTMGMLHEANYCNKTLDIPYTYIKNVLSCDKCDGNGKTDWVEAARGIPPRRFIQTDDHTIFTRNKHAAINIIEIDSGTPHYVSTVQKSTSEEYCNHCCGSGLFLAQPWCIKGSVKVKQS